MKVALEDRASKVKSSESHKNPFSCKHSMKQQLDLNRTRMQAFAME